MQKEALEWNLGFIVIESTITGDVDQHDLPLPRTYIKMINHYQVFVSRGSAMDTLSNTLSNTHSLIG